MRSTRALGCLLVAVLMMVGVSGMCRAGILYDAATNTIKVTDFPAELPCDLARLISLDEMYEWGKVKYDKATDTYTVSANLTIGANDGTETYFVIGSKAHPKETLVMKGNLFVYPYFVQGQNEGDAYKAPKKVNRLTLGDPTDKTITATLKFDCETKAQFGLTVGAFLVEGKSLGRGTGGQLHVYNSTITAATQDAAHAFGSPYARGMNYLCGDSIIFDGATYSWVAGFMSYGMSGNHVRTVNSTFAYGGAAVDNGPQRLINCTFKGCETAILDQGCMDAVAIDCTFVDNQTNWRLPYSNKGLICIDCTIGEPTKGNFYWRWDRVSEKLKGPNQYPYFAEQHRVVVEVVDAAGKPVPNAKVSVSCEQELAEWEEVLVDMLENGERVTGAAGRTPGEGEERPIILTKLIVKATDEQNKPISREYTYTIKVSSQAGVTAEVKAFTPTKRFEVVRIVLK